MYDLPSSEKVNLMEKPEDFNIFEYDKEKFEKTGILDCFQNVSLFNLNLSSIPFKFGVVKGYFSCSYNNLTSLKNSPLEVTGSFLCDNNKLKNLNFSPLTVGGDFECQNNLLQSLNCMPKKIGNILVIDNNPLNILDWIKILETFPKNKAHYRCDVVSENSSYFRTLELLKMKQKIISLIKE